MTDMMIEALSDQLGLPWLPHQEEALTDALDQVESGAWLRLCLYHRTGAGKTYTSLASVALAGAQEVVVVAPPITQGTWVEAGLKLGLKVTPMSHTSFRMKKFKADRKKALIVDEFHLLGGHTGVGWTKLDRVAKGLQAPLVICSATPNYNDAERVYCIQHVIDPESVPGGFLQFLFDHCKTSVNPFGSVPLVDGFRNFDDAEQYLAALPRVHYVEDETIKQITIGDVLVAANPVPAEFDDLGLDRDNVRIMASQMEKRHTRKRLATLSSPDQVHQSLYDQIAEVVGYATGPVLIFSQSEKIATALHHTAVHHGARSLIVTGKTPVKKKASIVETFKRGGYDVLIGTATLATGTDGIDKMCDTLLIVDDTDDDALRRQLMGRILPRGVDSDVSRKQVWRMVYP